MDSRIRYDVLACTVMVNRCMADIVIGGEELMSIHTMPRMLIAPFTPDVARTTPPLRFELCAAKMARSRRVPEENLFENKWDMISSAGSNPAVIRAE